jgi:hypothetical protein
MEPEQEPVKVYSSYTEAQKRATKKYRELNKEKVNAQRKKYYDERKAKDPEFLNYKREKAKEYYIKKKSLKSNNQFDILADHPEEEVKEEEKSSLVIVTEPEEEEAPPFEELKVVKPKTPRKPRAVTKKSSDVVEIIHEDPLVPQEVPDTIEEHLEKKSKAKKSRGKSKSSKENINPEDLKELEEEILKLCHVDPLQLDIPETPIEAEQVPKTPKPRAKKSAKSQS